MIVTIMSEDIYCPRCKTSKYRNPSLKLFVNVCGHALCDNCVDTLFVKGSGNCPVCSTNLRKNNFRIQLFEDGTVEKDVDIRKKILKDFNKREEDFDSLEEYNDYLELVEDIIYNLTNNINVEATKKKIEQYKKENAESISRNRGKLSKDEEMIKILIEQEKEQEKWRTVMIEQEELDLNKAKKMQKEALVDDLIFSNLPVDQILAQHANEKKILAQKQIQLPKPPSFKPWSQPTFSTGIKVGKASNVFIPDPKVNEGTPFIYVKPNFNLNGPKVPSVSQIESNGYLNHIRNVTTSESAGGFLAKYSCLRALQEAFGGLYYESNQDV